MPLYKIALDLERILPIFHYGTELNIDNRYNLKHLKLFPYLTINT